jgi:hypothetical protein
MGGCLTDLSTNTFPPSVKENEVQLVWAGGSCCQASGYQGPRMYHIWGNDCTPDAEALSRWLPGAALNRIVALGEPWGESQCQTCLIPAWCLSDSDSVWSNGGAPLQAIKDEFPQYQFQFEARYIHVAIDTCQSIYAFHHFLTIRQGVAAPHVQPNSTFAQVVSPSGVAWRLSPNFNDRMYSLPGPAAGTTLSGTVVVSSTPDPGNIHYLQVAVEPPHS